MNSPGKVQAPATGSDLKSNPMSGSPVYLHGMWRTASTFLFGRFRGNAGYRCYYEPLHEKLAKLTARAIDQEAGSRAARKLRHETMDAPYFDEFRPLLRRWWRGVRNFHERFAIRDFFDTPDAALERYLAMLAEHAEREGRRAMCKFCRSYGRLEALRRLLPGRHVYLQRSPRDQWQSYIEKHSYFMAMTCVIAALRPAAKAAGNQASSRLSRPLPSVEEFSGWFGPSPLWRMFGVGSRYLKSLSHADQYRVFYGEWRAARASGMEHCHEVLDVDRMSVDDAYRQQIESTYGVSLEGCRVRRYDSYAIPSEQLDEIEAEFA